MSGEIHPDARAMIDQATSATSTVISRFLDAGFDVTWAKELNTHNSLLTFCLLKPDDILSQAYGFRYEVVIVIHPYSVLEPRTFQAINGFMLAPPARGRADAMFYFLVSKAKNCEEVTFSYLFDHKEERIAVPMTMASLTAKNADGWLVRNALQRHYMTLDRFKNTLPLREDTYFFGRQHELTRLLDATKRAQNAGLFGLRKTGKTSLLLKLQRAVERDPADLVLFLDCQSTSVRLRHWNELLEHIIRLGAKRTGFPAPSAFHPVDAAELFSEAVNDICNGDVAQRLLLIFDEVEWISPQTAKDRHWDDEFANFWHAVRTHQTRHSNLSVVIAGVNPHLVEIDNYNGFQNPLFGIVTPTFLAGLSRDEADEMVESIGNVMGLRFSADALTYIYDQYAGHPLLTRLGCSVTAELAKEERKVFPLSISDGYLRRSAQFRDAELRFYCAHVVAELAQFYPTEYELLERLAIGDSVGYSELARGKPDAIRHLLKYSIVGSGDSPYIVYDVLRDFIAEENARRLGRPTRFWVAPRDDRRAFVRSRMRSVIEDVRVLESSIRRAQWPGLFGPNSFPEADRLTEIVPPEDANGLSAALTPLYRSFVESIEVYGKSVNIKDYFWSVVKQQYPHLHDALHRIKVYRHNAQHLELVPNADAALVHFLTKDLQEQTQFFDEKYWFLFQRTVDELVRALQIEIALERS